jgi:F-type H+-transporting ATPase subunit beta
MINAAAHALSTASPIDDCDTLRPDAPACAQGVVVAVRGSVVDVRFSAGLPAIRSLLHAGPGDSVVLEAASQLDDERVRCVALSSTQGLARGTAVRHSGGPLLAPVGPAIVGRMFDVFGRSIDGQPVPTKLQWRSVHSAPPPRARRSTQ